MTDKKDEQAFNQPTADELALYSTSALLEQTLTSRCAVKDEDYVNNWLRENDSAARDHLQRTQAYNLNGISGSTGPGRGMTQPSIGCLEEWLCHSSQKATARGMTPGVVQCDETAYVSRLPEGDDD